MDSLVAAALEEISADGLQGSTLSKLWKGIESAILAMQMQLDEYVKQVIWEGLIKVPGLALKAPEGSTLQFQSLDDPCVHKFQDAERLGVSIVASEELRNSCLGLYDYQHADHPLSKIQRAILERLAKARTEGVTQSKLGKEFGMEGNKLFYILRSLETRGLLVRRSTILRTKDAQSGGSSIVTTNLVHLTRYAKVLPIASHQRFEINAASEDPVGDNTEEHKSEDKDVSVTISDDFPAMRQICDKLEVANEKVLIVSDLKVDLGFRSVVGHRAWRRLVKRLQDVGCVEVFNAKVGRKATPCIRLLKPFSAQFFVGTHGDADGELKGPKRGQVTEQVMELPVDQQIFDIIEGEGEEGLTMMEVWKRLGLNNKRNYHRVQNMTLKHGILYEAENHKKSMLYRLRTATNASQVVTTDLKNSSSRSVKDPCVSNEVCAALSPKLLEDTQEIKELTVETLPDKNDMELALLDKSQAIEESNSMCNLKKKPAKVVNKAGHSHSCLSVTTESLQREVRILQRLQEEKFIIRAELHRWLEELENRTTTMDRKTLSRVLQRLQQRDECKCILVSMPGTTNCGRKRTTEVVMLPSMNVESDLLKQIHERVRKFDMECRGRGIPKKKINNCLLPVYNGLKRAPVKKIIPQPHVTMQANGFIPSKMVRVRMLHHFLWDYVSDLDGNQVGDDLNPGKMFGLAGAIHAMPLQLFLQIIGSPRIFKDLPQRCRQGIRMSDLSEEEHSAIMDANAGGRLAWLVDVLRRLKLIRLMVGKGTQIVQRRWFGDTSISKIEASLTYALERHLHLEEPPAQSPISLRQNSCNLTSLTRHNFDVVSKEKLDDYWQTLEYFFAGSEASLARHVFPGSSVPELFGLRSWTSLRIMTVEQRLELTKRINEGDKRKSVQECAQIAKDLHLTLEQVLRVSYEKNRRLRLNHDLMTPSDTSKRTLAAVSKLPCNTGEQYRSHMESTSSISAGFGHLFPKADGIKELDNADEDEEDGDNVNHISVVSKLKPCRAKRFPWSDRLDRVLLFCYAKERAKLGTRVNRVDWNSIVGLPAPTVVCRRRMALLKMDRTIKKAILNLCSLLAARFEKHGDMVQNMEKACLGSNAQESSSQYGQDFEEFQTTELPISEPQDAFEGCSNEKVLDSSNEQPEVCATFSHDPENRRFSFKWDDINEPSIVFAINEVIRCKNLIRSCSSKRVAVTGANSYLRSAKRACISVPQAEVADGSAPTVDPLHLSNVVAKVRSVKQASSGTPGLGKLKTTRVRKKRKERPASLQVLDTKEAIKASLGISNAIEFIKLVLLNTSVNGNDVQLPKPFLDALRKFKESDVFAAFNFLRENDFLVNGRGAQAYILSQKFHQKASASHFPAETAEAALVVSKWVVEHTIELEQDWVPFTLENNYGQILHLFGLATAGKVLLSPIMPNKGIGETEDPRSIGCGMKRKPQVEEARSTKQKSGSNDAFYQSTRRERGFPAIEVHVHLKAFDLAEMLNSNCSVPHEAETNSICDRDRIPEFCGSLNLCSLRPTDGRQACEVEQLINDFCSSCTEGPKPGLLREPGLLLKVLAAVNKAGNEGLNFQQVKEVLDVSEEIDEASELANQYIETLETLYLVKRINAFDDVKVLAYAEATPYLLSFPIVDDSFVSTLDQGPLNSTMEQDRGYSVDPDTTMMLSNHLAETGAISVRQDSDSKASNSGNSLNTGTEECSVSSVGAFESHATMDGCMNYPMQIDTNINYGQSMALPIFPWLLPNGACNTVLLDSMMRRVLSIVVCNPGITEDSIIEQMDSLNPQTLRELLQLVELDGKLLVRTNVYEQNGPPSLLQNLSGGKIKPSFVKKRHFFASPLCAVWL